jgi:tetratricopeptide (TPR) repeat protein
MALKAIAYTKACFVIMPFGKKKVEIPSKRPTSTKKTVVKVINFDAIYDDIFRPAINAVTLPEGGKLVARRTDRDFFAGSISREMFRYIEYSRFALADITGLNANVFFELGARYRARESGTAIFRLPDAPIPFDINQIKAVAYEYEPDERAADSRKLITRVLRESLAYNRLDSPVQEALDIQQQAGAAVEESLHKAENAIRLQDWAAARQYYERALKQQPTNPLLHFRVGLMWRDLGKWDEAITAFSAAVKHSPDYAEAYRELGIAQNKQYNRAKQPPDGIEALQRAVQLKPDDFDALSSLGGALRRAGKNGEALARYQEALRASQGHPYPLLNVMKLEGVVDGKPVTTGDRTLLLRRAERFRRIQVEHVPPIDFPWSLFDLAEIQLYLGRPGEFLRLIDDALTNPVTRGWQAKTFRETLEFLANGLAAKGTPLPAGLQQAIDVLRNAEPQLLE